MSVFFSALLLFLSLGHPAIAESDNDLLSFKTLPLLKAPKLEFSYYDRDQVAPGYWFLAPYTMISPDAPNKKWTPCQVGPYIYDQDGILIWAGSCMFDNRNIFDFKAVDNIDDNFHLSFILQHAFNDDGSDKGIGYVLDNHYEEEHAVPVTNDLTAFNMHEFNIMDDGKTALACAYKAENVDLGDLGRPEEHGFIQSGGFVELDMETGEVLFEWMSDGHVPIHESVKVHPKNRPAAEPGWDFIHVNSIDKNEAGDYLLSARFTNTIYVISGQNGDIMYRIGGKYSDIELQDFTFSKQHHARFIQSNETHMTISFLNNASDELEAEEDTSSALYVQIDLGTKTAHVVNRINRPDGALTRLRGSVQTLPNGNVFVGWSERGYQSEHAPDGKLLFQSKFVSTRYSSYRSYKFPFVGRPSTPPDLLANVYGTSEEDFNTIFTVSWNGATDIATWNFYARLDGNSVPVHVGSVNKTDFETTFVAEGYLDFVSAQALDRDGHPLGKSKIHRTKVPTSWAGIGYHGVEKPTPDDPSILFNQKAASADHEGMDMDEHDPAHGTAEEAAKAVYKAYEVIRGVGGLLIFILVTCSIGGVLAGGYYVLRNRRRPVQVYDEVPSDEGMSVAERR